MTAEHIDTIAFQERIPIFELAIQPASLRKHSLSGHPSRTRQVSARRRKAERGNCGWSDNLDRQYIEGVLRDALTAQASASTRRCSPSERLITEKGVPRLTPPPASRRRSTRRSSGTPTSARMRVKRRTTATTCLTGTSRAQTGRHPSSHCTASGLRAPSGLGGMSFRDSDLSSVEGRAPAGSKRDSILSLMVVFSSTWAGGII